MQELGIDVAALLHEHVDFLENVGDVELPEGLAVARETLLGRTRALLERATSPEPYLDMSAGRASSVDGNLNGTIEEYIAAEERTPQRGSLHYNESFQEFPGREGGKNEVDKELENLKLMYTSFTATQAKGRAIKSGTLLHVRRERKMFAPLKVFWLNKSCWVCLVGSHLLLYASERDSHPYQVVPLRGYSCRAAPGALPRDPRRSDAAFEIFCPGERTVQFAAKSAAEMREWVEAVTASVEPAGGGSKTKSRAPTFVEILDLEANERACIERVKEEQGKYQDVLSSPKSKPKEKQPVPPHPLPAKPIPVEVELRSEPPREEAPPLPARTRRLPSLPSSQEDEAAAAVFVARDEPYDEEGLYHCVEDVRAQAEYQNCRAVAAVVVPETYDDVETAKEEPGQTYDDVQSVMRSARDEPISYDDVQSVASNLRARTDKPDKAEKSEKPEKASKPQQKRSFLGRMYKRKESMRKDERGKPAKSPPTSAPASPTSPAPPKAPEELPCYDDVSSLTSPASPVAAPEENYLTPPPPRPIYSQPPAVSKCVVMPPEDIYDDIGSCIEISRNGCHDCLNVDVIKNYPNNGSVLSDLQLSIEQEHYQVPKSSLRRVVEQQQQHQQQQEEMYDDVQLSETFKKKQRDSLAVCPERSVWSRFSGAKRQTLGTTDTDDPKVRPLHKLFSKVETTLGKATKVNGVAN